MKKCRTSRHRCQIHLIIIYMIWVLSTVFPVIYLFISTGGWLWQKKQFWECEQLLAPDTWSEPEQSPTSCLELCCHPMVLTCFTSVLINTQHNTPKHTHVMTFLHPLFVIWSLHTCHCTMGKCTSGGHPTICTNWQLFYYLEKPSFVNICLKTQLI